MDMVILIWHDEWYVENAYIKENELYATTSYCFNDNDDTIYHPLLSTDIYVAYNKTEEPHVVADVRHCDAVYVVNDEV